MKQVIPTLIKNMFQTISLSIFNIVTEIISPPVKYSGPDAAKVCYEKVK
jgi:hypothetical protein